MAMRASLALIFFSEELRVSVEAGANHGLKRQLRLRDLVPMQILLVVGVTWCGIAAKQGG